MATARVVTMRKIGYKQEQSCCHGWNGVHFYVHGKRVCTTPSQGMHIDLRGIMKLQNRKVRFVKEGWSSPKDCKKCTKIFLELLFYFQSIPNTGKDRILR